MARGRDDREASNAGRESLEDRAYELALFLHGSPDIAAAVAAAALSKLKVAATAQERRLSYLPKGRRTRVSTGEMHLLQRLIYIESEPFERRAEETGDPEEVDMIMRYVEYLVRIAWKRSSFYAVLGISRLLHRYDTPETMDLYALVVQDPGQIRDDYAYRSCKKRLMEELIARFGERLEVVSGERGAQRFCSVAEAGPYGDLVAECLRRFTPWETDCPVPEAFDPLATELPALVFAGDDPDCQHAVEVRRFHAGIHPACYRRLVASLRLPPPEQKLSVPRFRRLERGPGGPLGTEGRAKGRGSSVRCQIAGLLAAEERRRRQSRGRFLSVWIDGEERARLDREGGRVVVDAGEGAELVEVRGDDAVLAVCLLGGGATEGERSLALDRGETISFEVGAERPGGGVRIEVACQPARSLAVALWNRLSRWVQLPAWGATRVRVAYAAALLGLLLGWGLWRFGALAPAGDPPLPGSDRPLSAGPGEPTVPTAPPRVPAPRGQAPRPSIPPATPDPSARAGRPVEGDPVRGVLPGPPAVPLRQVKTIFVDPLGEGAFAAELRAALTERLLAEGVFAVPEERESVDAVLAGSTDASGRMTLSLIDAEGKVLWKSEVPTGQPVNPAAAVAVAALRQAVGR